MTAFVTWSSTAPTIATSASTVLSVAPPIASISRTPRNPSLAVGATQQFTATATYTDATTGDVTNMSRCVPL
ncbi:MAG: hypothetical protein DMG32_02900 [Acidobacteria bacterium]|nr:MAG: hypothetical protein DMG32_02900 [Acidobacteriota bacterium]